METTKTEMLASNYFRQLVAWAAVGLGISYVNVERVIDTAVSPLLADAMTPLGLAFTVNALEWLRVCLLVITVVAAAVKLADQILASKTIEKISQWKKNRKKS